MSVSHRMLHLERRVAPGAFHLGASSMGKKSVCLTDKEGSSPSVLAKLTFTERFH